MFLKVMKTLFNILLLSLICSSVYAQENTFRSKANKPFTDFFADTSTCNTDTTQHIAFSPRLYLINSTEKSTIYTSHLVGATISTNIKNYNCKEI